jgi:2,3-diketo-5-methylthiopentyl-1-phosphate enolase
MSKLYDENIFQFTGESVVDDRHVIATYYLEDSIPGETFIDHLQMVASIALEGSTGTWMRIREDTPELRHKLTGKCVGYYEIPSDDPHTKKAIVQIALPTDAWQANAPMLLLAVAGNCFAVSNKARVLDVTFPKSIIEQFPGPRFGVEGMRKLLDVPERPLTLHIIKPKMGMTPEQTAQQVYDTAMGGADLAKDDEMCSDVYNSDTIDRARAVAEAVDRAAQKTGRKLCYLVSVTDEVDKVADKAKRAIEAGAGGILVAYSVGFSMLKVLASDPDINVPIMLHPSHMVSLLPSINWPTLVKFVRLCGGDMMMGPSIWSSMPVTSLEEALRTAQVAQAPMHGLKRMWAMPSAGVHPGLVDILVDEYGTDMIAPAGGGTLGHPMGYTAGAKAMRQAVDAKMAGMSREEAAEKYPELKAAFDCWGIPERPKTSWLFRSKAFQPKTISEQD